ncbi:MAG: hypothetical protein IPH89_00190 [Bacteroidetes bacterium]|nr:hypothetical protein [Bacteroidota bacterium]
MKTLKISLALIVVAAITFFVIRSFVAPDKVEEIKSSGNPFIDKIQQEIKTLQLKPENKFCKEYYTEVSYHIDDYHKNSRLGKSKLENDQWKENLSKQLYAAYTDKFIKQAYYIFNRSDWAINDLSFIRNEYRTLQSSPMLERNSPIDRRFNEIKSIINKHDEITVFIASCKGFSYSQKDLDMQFPIVDVSSKISKAISYRNNRLENSFVNNCTRLHSGLNEIPQALFRAHVKYLDNMINTWSNMFTNYNSQKAYVDGIYSPLENKIDELDNNIYKVSDFSSEYDRLKEKWQNDGTRAYNHFN